MIACDCYNYYIRLNLSPKISRKLIVFGRKMEPLVRASAIETDVTVALARARADEVTNFYVAT